MPGDDFGQHRHDEVVEFGRGHPGGRRWRSRALLAGVIVAAVVLVAVRAAGHHARPAAQAPPPPPVRVTLAGHPLLGVTAGWELFARGPDELLRIQFARGRVTQTYVPTLQSGDPNVAMVVGAHEAIIRSPDLVPGYVIPDGGQARLLTGPLAHVGPLVDGPGGTGGLGGGGGSDGRDGTQAAWVTSGPPTTPVLSLLTLAGHPSGPVIRFSPGGPQLPATAVSDGRGDVLVTSGSFAVYDVGPGWDRHVPGNVLAVGPANWLVITCGHSDRHCRDQVIDAANGSRRLLPGRVVAEPYDFFWPPTGVIAPDGRTAAVAEAGPDGLTAHLIDLRTGSTKDLGVPLGLPGGNRPLGAYTGQLAWSPDSRWLFVAAATGKLVAVNAHTARPESLQVTLPPVAQVAIRP